eukprot:2801116-Pyramimonas_sp.AAC.1
MGLRCALHVRERECPLTLGMPMCGHLFVEDWALLDAKGDVGAWAVQYAVILCGVLSFNICTRQPTHSGGK